MLPKHVSDDLIAASKMNASIPRGNSKERTKAIDEIVRIAKVNYPHKFHNENHFNY